MPSLQQGMDINIHFDAVNSFEFTPSLSIFDICRIPIYHGWVCNPFDADVYNLVGKQLKSYNAVLEAIIQGDVVSSQKEDFSGSPTNRDEIMCKATVCTEFLDATATQLTETGLQSLHRMLHPDQPAVFFRNNHFLVIVLHQDILWTLVTDQGFLESSVVWESLDDINGNSSFYDSNFIPFDESIPPEEPAAFDQE